MKNEAPRRHTTPRGKHPSSWARGRLSSMDLESIVREHPALTLVTVAGAASAATVLAFREMGCKPTRPSSAASAFVWDHPVLTALGAVAGVVVIERLLRPNGALGSIVTGVRRAPSLQRQLGGARQLAQRSALLRQAGGQHQPGGTTRPGAYAQHQPLTHQQVPGRASTPSVQAAPYASASTTPYQSSSSTSTPQMRQATTASATAPAQQHQQQPSWAADVAHDFSWPPG